VPRTRSKGSRVFAVRIKIKDSRPPTPLNFLLLTILNDPAESAAIHVVIHSFSGLRALVDLLPIRAGVGVVLGGLRDVDQELSRRGIFQSKYCGLGRPGLRENQTGQL